MKYFLILALLIFGSAGAQEGTMENHLRSRIYRSKEAPPRLAEFKLPSEDKVLGRTLASLVPLKDVSAIETSLDEIDLPNQLISLILLQGCFVKSGRKTGQSHPVTLHWAHQILSLSYSPGRVTLGSLELQVPETVKPESALEIKKQVLRGRTRKQLEAFLYADGGLSQPFRLERYVLSSSGNSGPVVKLNLEFRPGKPGQKSTAPEDILVRKSPPYLEPAYFD